MFSKVNQPASPSFCSDTLLYHHCDNGRCGSLHSSFDLLQVIEHTFNQHPIHMIEQHMNGNFDVDLLRLGDLYDQKKNDPNMSLDAFNAFNTVELLELMTDRFGKQLVHFLHERITQLRSSPSPEDRQRGETMAHRTGYIDYQYDTKDSPMGDLSDSGSDFSMMDCYESMDTASSFTDFGPQGIIKKPTSLEQGLDSFSEVSDDPYPPPSPVPYPPLLREPSDNANFDTSIFWEPEPYQQPQPPAGIDVGGLNDMDDSIPASLGSPLHTPDSGTLHDLERFEDAREAEALTTKKLELGEKEIEQLSQISLSENYPRDNPQLWSIQKDLSYVGQGIEFIMECNTPSPRTKFAPEPDPPAPPSPPKRGGSKKQNKKPKDNKRFVCGYGGTCTKGSDTKYQHEKHLRDIHCSKKYYACFFCGNEFHGQEHVRRHLKEHCKSEDLTRIKQSLSEEEGKTHDIELTGRDGIKGTYTFTYRIVSGKRAIDPAKKTWGWVISSKNILDFVLFQCPDPKCRTPDGKKMQFQTHDALAEHTAGVHSECECCSLPVLPGNFLKLHTRNDYAHCGLFLRCDQCRDIFQETNSLSDKFVTHMMMKHDYSVQFPGSDYVYDERRYKKRTRRR